MRKVYKCVTACGLCASGGPIEKTVLYKDDSPAFMGGGIKRITRYIQELRKKFPQYEWSIVTEEKEDHDAAY